jgi:hypothetical protein
MAMLFTVALASTARAEPQRRPQTTVMVTPRWDLYNIDVRNQGTPSEKLDEGYGFGVGAAYLHLPGDVAPVAYGVGVDVRALTFNYGLGGTSVTALAKATIGHAPPMTFELDAGAIIGDDSGAVVGGGVYLWMMYLELGYSYQRPIGIADPHRWLGHHQVTIRGLIPVFSR